MVILKEEARTHRGVTVLDLFAKIDSNDGILFLFDMPQYIG